MHTPRPLILCAALCALSFAPSVFAIEHTKSIGLPANGYTYPTDEFPDGQEGRIRFVCRIFLDRELLAELSRRFAMGRYGISTKQNVQYLCHKFGNEFLAQRALPCDLPVSQCDSIFCLCLGMRSL